MQDYTKILLVTVLIVYENFVPTCQAYEESRVVSNGPCEDFYEYACSNYSQQNMDPNYSEIIQKMDYEMNKNLLTHLSNSFNYYNYDKIQGYKDKMGIYLESCNEETQRNLKKYLDIVKPGDNLNWPLLYPTKEWLVGDKQFNYLSLLGEMHTYGLNNVIVNQQITRNKNHTLSILLAPALAVDGGALADNNILQVLLLALNIQDTASILTQLTNTDLKLQAILKNYANNTESHDMTLQELSKLYPRLNLTSYLEKLLDRELNNLEKITLENPQYFRLLNDKLWSAEEQKHLCNYLMMKFLYYLVMDSAAEFKSLECIKDLRTKFDVAVNYHFYRYYYVGYKRCYEKALDNLLNNIKTIMAKYFNENHLNLSQQQLHYLQNKLEKIKINIGNLPANRSYRSVNAYYQDIPNLERFNYCQNHLLMLKHRFNKSLHYAQNQSHFIVSDNRMGGVSTPFYVPEQNMIVIPFGSLQSPFFNYTQTLLEQFSLFGFVLAHELTHAFDTTSLNYDHEGLPLSSPSDILDHANFTAGLECMLQQEPTNEIDERIADFFAVHVVYRTYAEYYAQENVHVWSRKFFMNLAQFFCGKNNLQFIDHDSDATRLRQILINFQPFSDAFGCSVGTKMHSATKCRLY